MNLSYDLDGSICRALSDLETYGQDTPEYKKALETVETLGKLKQAAYEFDEELALKQEQQSIDCAKAKRDESANKWGIGLKIAEVAVSIAGLACGVGLAVKGFRFEETGCFTSQTMKGIFPKFLKFGK